MKVDRTTHSRDMVIRISKMAGGRILDLVQPEVGPFDPPSPKTLPLSCRVELLSCRWSCVVSSLTDVVCILVLCMYVRLSVLLHIDLFGFSWLQVCLNKFSSIQFSYVASNTKSIGRSAAEIWLFKVFQNVRSVGRSVVGPQYIHCFHVLFATLGT